MATHRTKDTTALSMELPTPLLQRLREFSKRDMRTLKAEVVRAILFFLEKHDLGENGATLSSAQATLQDTVREEKVQSSFPVNEQTFDKLLMSIKPRKNYALFHKLLVRLQAGLSHKEILAKEEEMDATKVQQVLSYFEEQAKKVSK